MGSSSMYEQDKENKEVPAGTGETVPKITERVSVNLGVPYIYLKRYQRFLCANGVLFTLQEYKDGIDLNAEYDRREKEDNLYDYDYAKNTGLLRKKKKAEKAEEKPEEGSSGESEVRKVLQDNTDRTDITEEENEGSNSGRRNYSSSYRQEERQGFSVFFIVALLAFTSLISGYISTLQTATYLYDYVDKVSSWLMSTSVTAYNVTAFEVAVLFRQNRRFGLTFIFISLWTIVTLFSMATAVSVFYDRFNFSEYQVAEENRETDSNRLALELLQKKEADLREAISFKKKDIEYRQEKEYATTAVRKELVELEAELQSNLSEQQNLLSKAPEVTRKVTKRKERLFAFLGRLMHVDSGIFEFTMSTLSAIFVNLIAPMSLVAVTELKKKRLDRAN